MFLLRAHPARTAVTRYMAKFTTRSGVEIPLPTPKAIPMIIFKDQITAAGMHRTSLGGFNRYQELSSSIFPAHTDCLHVQQRTSFSEVINLENFWHQIFKCMEAQKLCRQTLQWSFVRAQIGNCTNIPTIFMTWRILIRSWTFKKVDKS